MPRIARIVIPGVPYHITQRGNRREDVFLTDTDRHVYLKLLKQYTLQYGLEIKAWCLMTNHLHLVAVPQTEHALSRTLKPVHLRYTQHFNWTHNQTGRLWQGRFFSCALDDTHFWSAMRYVERNPVRARMVARAEEYAWSSARFHCGDGQDPLIGNAEEHPRKSGDWRNWLRRDDDEQTITVLRRNTQTGRPLGGEVFLKLIETTLGRTVRPRKAGRPKKSKGTI